jgi:toxin FitB
MKAVVDSCGWIEFILGEENASFFEPILLNERQLIVPPLVIFEVSKRLLVLNQPRAASAFLSVVERCARPELTPMELFNAAETSRLYKLAMADAIIWQTARENQATLYTQDQGFQGLPSVQYKVKK